MRSENLYNEVQIPKNLLLGTATASLQIEGGDTNNDWYRWANTPGNIKDGSHPERCVDHWEKWREDTQLLSEIGIEVYRMSLEWARIEPECGKFSTAAIEHYREEISELRARGIIPLVSLHHFSNPIWFADKDGFTNPESVELFLRYTEYVVNALKDLVDEWVTINEPNVYVTQGYLFHTAPPNEESWRKVRANLRHLAQAHCLAYRLIHQLQPEAKVGFAHHIRPFVPLNPESRLQRQLTKFSEFAFQDVLSDAMLGGSFHPLLGSPRPAGRKEKIAKGKYYDYLGVNYYSRTATSKLDDGVVPGTPRNDLGWEIYPQGLIEITQKLFEKYPGPIWVTENGTCDTGELSAAPRLADTKLESFRPRFIYDQLRCIAASDLPFERYYYWCFVDNFEWSEGMAARFGLVYLDPHTKERIVKPSGHFYQEIIAKRLIDSEMYRKYVSGQEYRSEAEVRLP